MLKLVFYGQSGGKAVEYLASSGPGYRSDDDDDGVDLSVCLDFCA